MEETETSHNKDLNFTTKYFNLLVRQGALKVMMHYSKSAVAALAALYRRSVTDWLWRQEWKRYGVILILTIENLKS